MVNTLRLFNTIFCRDLILAYRRGTQLVNPLVFFIMVVVLFRLALANTLPLQYAMSAMIWSALLLASCLSLEYLFRTDFEDGMLAQFALSRYPLTVIVAAKIAAHWFSSGLPLLIIALIIALILSLPMQSIIALGASLLISTPILSLIGAVIAALTVGLSANLLLSLLILPLYMPIIIISMVAVENATVGQSIAAELYFLAGILVLMITLAPLATAAAIKIRLSE